MVFRGQKKKNYRYMWDGEMCPSFPEMSPHGIPSSQGYRPNEYSKCRMRMREKNVSSKKSPVRHHCYHLGEFMVVGI